MKFYRCELRDCISETDMHYALTFDEALEYCRKDFASGNLGDLHHTYWLWQEETGYDKDPKKLGIMRDDGVFIKVEDEPIGFCDYCDKPMRDGDKEYLRDDGPCSCVVYCSQECIDAYQANR